MNYFILNDRYDDIPNGIVITNKSQKEIQEWIDTLYMKWNEEKDVSCAFSEMLLDNLLEDTQIILNTKFVYF